MISQLVQFFLWEKRFLMVPVVSNMQGLPAFAELSMWLI